MRYDISLTVDYQYDSPSDQARSLLHLMPRTIPGRQRVTAASLSVDPAPGERHDGVDFFGNVATWIAFHRPTWAFALSLRAEVTLEPAPIGPDLSPPLAELGAEIAGWQGLEPDAPHHFTGPSDRVAVHEEITAFARAHVDPEGTVLGAVLAIGAALHEAMIFDPEATDAHTPPETAFAQRRGVCQDFSHVMIAALRGLGVPAGYVSGFLRTLPPPGQPRLEGADAMHAWVRAWCGAAQGWVDYDPTNAIRAGGDHVVVGWGRDYADVAPVRGTVRSSGGHQTRHAVDVLALD